MIWWDRAFKSRLSDTGILVRLNKQYVDNINVAADGVRLGTRYENILLDLQIPIDRIHPVQISSRSDYCITTDIM